MLLKTPCDEDVCSDDFTQRNSSALLFVPFSTLRDRYATSLRDYFLTVEEVRATVLPDDVDYLSLLDRNSRLANPIVGGADWLNILHMEMQRRLYGKQGDRWILVIDEFTSYMKIPAGGLAAEIFETINQEARKLNMVVFMIGREWKATRTGGSELRHSISASIVHRMPVAVAELIAPPDAARQSLSLSVGEVLFTSDGPTKRVRVSYTDDAQLAKVLVNYRPRPYERVGSAAALSEATKNTDLQKLASTLALAGTFGEVDAMPPLPQRQDVPTDRPLRDLPLDATTQEVNQIRQLWLDGLEQHDIAKRVYGVRSGPDLAEKKIRVREILNWCVTNG